MPLAPQVGGSWENLSTPMASTYSVPLLSSAPALSRYKNEFARRLPNLVARYDPDLFSPCSSGTSTLRSGVGVTANRAVALRIADVVACRPFNRASMVSIDPALASTFKRTADKGRGCVALIPPATRYGEPPAEQSLKCEARSPCLSYRRTGARQDDGALDNIRQLEVVAQLSRENMFSTGIL